MAQAGQVVVMPCRVFRSDADAEIRVWLPVQRFGVWIDFLVDHSFLFPVSFGSECRAVFVRVYAAAYRHGFITLSHVYVRNPLDIAESVSVTPYKYSS